MYQRTYWQDEVRSPSNRYVVTDNADNTKTIVRAGTVMQPGTFQDQDHFNNMEVGITDTQIAVQMLLNALRQNEWEIERGEVSLTNSAVYPQNNSVQSVALQLPKENGDYVVLAEVKSFSGNVGEIVVSDKLANGFKIGYTGSASAATIKYTVIGGYLK